MADLVGPVAVAQGFVCLKAAGLPGFFGVRVVAYAQGQGVAHGGAELARIGMLHGNGGLQSVSPGGVQGKARIPGQTVALAGARGVFVHDRTGNLRGRARSGGGGSAAGQQLHTGVFFDRFERDDMALAGAGGQHEFAQQRVVAVVLRGGGGAVDVGCVVAAPLLQRTGASPRGGHHPLQAVAGPAGHGGCQCQRRGAAHTQGQGSVHDKVFVQKMPDYLGGSVVKVSYRMTVCSKSINGLILNRNIGADPLEPNRRSLQRVIPRGRSISGAAASQGVYS